MPASSHSFAEERRRAILSMLETSASVQVADLASAFGVSVVTARGDLDALAANGKLRRTHGGAVSLNRALTVSVQDRRLNVNVEAKQAIARAALDLIDDGDTLIVDSGTTALELVRTLGTKTGITVITPDVTIANYIDESLPATDVILLGGSLRKGHRYLYGPLALRSLEVLHASKAFLCPTSFVSGRGLMTNFEQMAELKRAFIGAAGRAIALIDTTKIDAPGLMRFADLHEVDTIVTNGDPDDVIAAEIAALVQDGQPAPQLIVTSQG